MGRFLTFLFALSLTLNTCSKEYECECYGTSSQGVKINPTTTTETHDNRDDAEEWCEEEETSNTECELSEAD